MQPLFLPFSAATRPVAPVAVGGLFLLLSGATLTPTRAQTPTPATAATATANTSAGSGLTAQEIEELGEAAPIVRDLRRESNKSVAIIFDVSGSMRGDTGNGTMLRRARNVASRVVRRALRPGDDISLYTFGAGYDVYTKKITSGEDREAVADRIPTQTGEGAGTNIRRPHRDALKAIEATLQANPSRPAAIVLLTDSFNDEPKTNDPAYADYARYYVPGQLSKYPDTPENRDYERLLQELVQSGKVKQYGIGINIAPNGRPIERVPQAAATPIPSVVDEPPTQEAPVTKAPEASFPYVWAGLGVLVLAGIGYFLFSGSKPIDIRITGGTVGAKNFQVRRGQSVRIGGDGAQFAADAYALPGVRDTVALIRAGRGGLALAPPTVTTTAKAAAPAVAAGGANTGAGGSNQSSAPRVFYNGLLLEQETPVGIGDEIRVSVPAGEAGGVPKEIRLKIGDPRSSY